MQLDGAMDSISIRNGSDLKGTYHMCYDAYPAQLERVKQY